jgi:hypothetical protein
MELWHWADTKINFAPSTFWYARPGAKANIEPDPKTAALPVARERTDIVPVKRVEGAIEGESLKVVERTGGKAETQTAGFGWSGDAQLWWMDGKVGDKLVLEFPVKEAGKYKVSAYLTKASDYAIVALSVNGQPPKKFDRYNRDVSRNLVELGTYDLKQGPNQLAVEIVGENPEAIHRRMFGLDYLKLQKQR